MNETIDNRAIKINIEEPKSGTFHYFKGPIMKNKSSNIVWQARDDSDSVSEVPDELVVSRQNTTSEFEKIDMVPDEMDPLPGHEGRHYSTDALDHINVPVRI